MNEDSEPTLAKRGQISEEHLKQPDEATKAKKNRKFSIALITLISVFAILTATSLGYIFWPHPEDNITYDSPAPVSTSSIPVESLAPPTCSTGGPIDNPTKFSAERTGIDTGIVLRGTDDHNAPIPPDNSDGHSVALWTDGPKPGSAMGHTIFSVHSFRNGLALGNKIKEGDTALKKGDQIKVSDDSGKVACYEIDKILKFNDAKYSEDPSAFDTVYSDTEPPHIVLITCTDYNWTGRYSESRILFYAKLI